MEHKMTWEEEIKLMNDRFAKEKAKRNYSDGKLKKTDKKNE